MSRAARRALAMALRAALLTVVASLFAEGVAGGDTALHRLVGPTSPGMLLSCFVCIGAMSIWPTGRRAWQLVLAASLVTALSAVSIVAGVWLAAPSWPWWSPGSSVIVSTGWFIVNVTSSSLAAGGWLTTFAAAALWCWLRPWLSADAPGSEGQSNSA